uniref:Late embryogenesis abundant protein LEA-2 subgroup domain-containing protein n=1 Tax=Oryza meridionalis TaxID=40149 RepID=A0A0E0CLM3_9ORYZ
MSKEKHHKREHHLRRCCGGMAACILALVLVVGFIALVVYLALRPSKPSFYLQDLQLRSVDLGDPSLSATAQVTLASRNPNDHVGVHYRRLDVFVTYRDEPVTVPVSLPPTYQGHRDVTIWSPVLSGESVPVAGFVADALRQDIAAGYVALQVKVDGRVKWKVGSWVSGSYHLFVSCPAMLASAGPGGVGPMPLGGAAVVNGTGAGAVASLRFTQPTGCSVEV